MADREDTGESARLVHRINNAVSYVVTNLALLSEEMQAAFERAPADPAASVTLTKAQLRRLLQLAADAQSGAERTGDLLRQFRVLTYGDNSDGVDDSADDTWDEERKGRKILVVDDEPFILASLQRALHRYDVVTAEGGQEAIQRLTENPTFDLVLCDLVMPPFHGSLVHKWIRENQPQLADRVIFMTAGAFTEEARGFLHSVRNPVLHKPFDTKTLRWAIGQALRRTGG